MKFVIRLLVAVGATDWAEEKLISLVKKGLAKLRKSADHVVDAKSDAGEDPARAASISAALTAALSAVSDKKD